MNVVLETSHHPMYVIVAVLCSIMGAYTALTVVYRLLAMRHAQINQRLDLLTRTSTVAPVPERKRAYATTLLLAGVAFGGLGIWVMHFVGSMGMQIPLALNYSDVHMVVSLFVAIGAATWGLGVLAVNPYSHRRLLVSGVILGSGIVAMHYIDMLGVRFDGFYVWNWGLIALSCAVAWAASTLALWMAFATKSNLMRLLAACVMGAAVSTMHYIGIEAGNVCTSSTLLPTQEVAALMGIPQTPVLVAMGVLLVVFTLMMDRMYNAAPKD